MIVLAIDTCDSKGSVAVLRGEVVLNVVAHESHEDYSSWLLPAVRKCLEGCGLRMEDVDAYAAAAGPGSFTGVRVGLTSVKAWGEVYGKPIISISRLEAIALQAQRGTNYVAAFADAQRGQVFGAAFHRNGTELERVGDELVLAPGAFVRFAADIAKGERISWASTDATCVLGEEPWKAREKLNESIKTVPSELAPVIARMGAKRFAAGEFTDALRLDANYVRRSDAEIFWKARPGGKS